MAVNEHVFTLSQALELYDIYQKKIAACDDEIEKQLSQFESRSDLTAEELTKLPIKKRIKMSRLLI